MNTPDETTPVAGHPNRRRFLFAGSAGVAAAAFIAACGQDVDTSDDFPLSGTAPTTSNATTEVVGPELDVTLLRTAQSLELAAIQGIQQLAQAPFEAGPNVLPTFELLVERHTSHVTYFEAQTALAGGQPYTEPNSYFMTSVVDAGVATLAAPKDVLALAVTIENTLAQTYVFAAEVMSTPQLREAVATVGFVSARQISSVYLLQGGAAAPTPTISRGARVPSKAFVPES